MSYLTSLPTSQKPKFSRALADLDTTGYKPNENIDFLLDFSGYEIIPDTTEFCGEFFVVKDKTADPSTPFVNADSVFMDPICGIDSVVQSVTVSVNDRIIETINEYPMKVKMSKAATKSKAMIAGDGEEVCALRCYDKLQTTLNTKVSSRKFCMKFLNSLNLNKGLSYSHTKQVKVSLLLASPKKVLFGTSVTNNTTYRLSDLHLDYQVRPDSKKPVEMVVNYMLKQNLNSANANLTMLLPQPTSKISASMIKTTDLNSLTENSLKMGKPDKVSRVELQLNDNSNNIVSYPLETEQEILENFLASYGNAEGNMCSIDEKLEDPLFGIGYNFTKQVMNQKASLKIESDINTPYTMYLNYSTLISF